MKLNCVIIGLGSNIYPERNIEEARTAIAETHNVLKSSAFIETEPIGYKNQNSFINGAILIETEMDKAGLKSWLKELEAKLGRVNNENKYGPRTIDLDILVWNSDVVDEEVYQREFLRESIMELLPEIKIGQIN